MEVILLERVAKLGQMGEVVRVKDGFARNYLLPQQKAVPASAHTLRMQAKLVEERAKKAAIDKKEAEAQAAKLGGLVLKITVKVDPEGHMYGSVGASDIIELFAKEGVTVGKRNIGLNKPIKATGVHPMALKLKEGVTCAYSLEIIGEQAQEHRG